MRVNTAAAGMDGVLAHTRAYKGLRRTWFILRRAFLYARSLCVPHIYVRISHVLYIRQYGEPHFLSVSLRLFNCDARWSWSASLVSLFALAVYLRLGFKWKTYFTTCWNSPNGRPGCFTSSQFCFSLPCSLSLHYPDKSSAHRRRLAWWFLLFESSRKVPKISGPSQDIVYVDHQIIYGWVISRFRGNHNWVTLFFIN